MIEKTNLKYGDLLDIAKTLCKSFYETDKRKFGPAVKTRDDEKNVIFSMLKFSIDRNYNEYNLLELQQAVSICVDEAAIRKYSSRPPPKMK
jgi:hypothetical protein